MKINRERLKQIIQEEVAAANRRDSSLREEADTHLTESNPLDDPGPVEINYGKDRGKVTLRPMDVFNRAGKKAQRQEAEDTKFLAKYKSQTPEERAAANSQRIRKNDKPLKSFGLGPFDYLPPAAFGKGIMRHASRFIEPAVGYVAGKVEDRIHSMIKKNRKDPYSYKAYKAPKPMIAAPPSKLEENRLDQIIQEEYEKLLQEHAKEYVWGVKAPYHRTANQYELSVLNHDILKEKGKHHDMACG